MKTMTRNDIENKVMEIVANQFGCNAPDDSINIGTDIENDLGGDSLDIIEIVMSCETGFGVSITDERAEGIRTVGDICSIVETLAVKEADDGHEG